MYYGWRLLIALCAIYFLSIGTVFYGFAATMPDLIQAFGWSRSQVSAGFSIASATLGLCGPLIAWMIRRFGTRMTIFMGGFSILIGALLTYTTQTVPQFYLSCLFLGLGLAMQTIIPGTQLISNWFARRRALAIGLFMAAGGVGSGVLTPLFALLVKQTGDWRIVWLIMTGAGMGSSLLALWVVKEMPADVGQQVDGVSETSSGSAKPVKQVRVYQTRHPWETKAAFSTVVLWLAILCASMASLGGGLVNTQALLHLQDLGHEKVLAASSIGLVGFLSVAGRVFSGTLGDYIEPKYMLSAGLLISLVGIYLLNIAHEPLLVYLFAILFGLGNGLAVVTSPMIIANYFGSKNYASLFAVRSMIVTIIAALGPVLAGAWFDKFNSYSQVFWFYIGMCLIAGIAALMMRPPIPAAQAVATS
ncbi:MAG TPA: MFS transporter [Pseudomonadales bacterium]|nr:MFS transporter [Pseudomonadales bacterium]